MTRAGDITRAVVVMLVWAVVLASAAACQPGNAARPSCHGYRIISVHARCEWGHGPGQRNHWSVQYG